MPAINPGHRLDELPIGRTLAYKLINRGELHAVKVAGCTIVLDWPAYLARQPAVTSAKKDTGAATAASLNRREQVSA